MMATARVLVEIEISGLGNYGPEWKIGDMQDQACREAINRIEQIGAKAGFRVIGTPRVSTIVTLTE